MNLKFRESKKPGKKYDALISADTWNTYRADKTTKPVSVSFGALGYEHYKDKIGNFSYYDHNDKSRRAQYRARHSKILNHGVPSYKIHFTPAWFSWHYLW